MELVYIVDLKSTAERIEGSNPSIPTNFRNCESDHDVIAWFPTLLVDKSDRPFGSPYIALVNALYTNYGYKDGEQIKIELARLDVAFLKWLLELKHGVEPRLLFSNLWVCEQGHICHFKNFFEIRFVRIIEDMKREALGEGSVTDYILK